MDPKNDSQRCAICLSTERVHESLLVTCKKCNFNFHKDCLNNLVEDDHNFICPSCKDDCILFFYLVNLTNCSLCTKTIKFPFEKFEDNTMCHMCCRFWKDFVFFYIYYY